MYLSEEKGRLLPLKNQTKPQLKDMPQFLLPLNSSWPTNAPAELKASEKGFHLFFDIRDAKQASTELYLKSRNMHLRALLHISICPESIIE